MLFRILLFVLVTALVAPLAAQAPAGLKVRVDQSTNAQDPDDTPELKVMAMGKGFHVVGGPAGTFWDPKNTVSGNYSVEASFRQMKAPEHPEAYGLFAAGTDMTAPGVNYLYFLVRRDGKWTLKHRADNETVHTIQDWTTNSAVQMEDSTGQSTNALSMAFGADSVRFSVNGTQVHAVPRATLESGPDHSGTVGVAGVRINHALDVQVTGFRINRM